MKFKLFSLLLVLLFLTGCTFTIGEPRVPTAAMPGEADRSVPAAAQNAVIPDVPASQPATSLTREQARAAALEHAGLTADQVSRIQVEYEIDDGIPLYEVQFLHDGWEYDYEIHAETGAILSFDRDRD